MQVSNLVENRQFPSVARFLGSEIQMQFDDLRVLLQLPLGDSKAGCNFATAAVLLNLLSGFSVCLFDADVEELKRQRGRGRRFKDMLNHVYPWVGESWPPEKCSDWLWEVARNPLSHSLGVQVSSIREWSGIAKRPLAPHEISVLETSPDQPPWLGPTLIQRPTNGEIGTFLSTPCLYWGTWRVLERLCADPTQMTKAENLLIQIGYVEV